MTLSPAVKVKARPRVVVFVHVHYPDLWEEIGGALAERMDYPFQLVVTTSGAEADIVIPRMPTVGDVRVVRAENRGRDIMPFLRALADCTEFDLGLKLHTKKSPQRDDGALWRFELLDRLLPPGGGVANIIERLWADSRVGFVAPAGFSLSVRPWIGINRDAMNRVMAAAGLEDRHLDDAFFSAGSMFWFRRDALVALASQATLALFEEEQGQLDATTAHAMERLFPVAARACGFVSLSTSALTASTSSMPVDKLAALARRHSDRPSTFFPAPNVPALPATKAGMRQARAIHRAKGGPVGFAARLRHAIRRTLSGARRWFEKRD